MSTNLYLTLIRLFQMPLCLMCAGFLNAQESINVTVSSSGGSIIGPIILHVNKRIEIDCSKCGAGGCKIPYEAHQIRKIIRRGEVKFILVVEKLTVFNMLTQLEFDRKYSCIIITGSGQPDLATRAALYKLSRAFSVPIYGFTDANPFGARIMCTFKFGSQNRAFDNLEHTVDTLQWIGLHPSDLEGKPGLSLLDKRDYSYLAGLLDLDYVLADMIWREQLVMMLFLGLKADIEQVLEIYELEEYLRKRIPEMRIDD